MIEIVALASAAAIGAISGRILNVWIDRLFPGHSSVSPILRPVTAAMFALCWWYYGPTPLLASRVLFGCALGTGERITLTSQR